MTVVQEVACPLTGLRSKSNVVVVAGNYKVAWIESSRMWSVIDMPSMEKISDAYQDFNAGEHSRNNFDYYLNQSKLILAGELSRAGIDKTAIKNLCMLDYGCGGGHFVGAASQLRMRAVGMELDSTAVTAARAIGINVVNGVLPNNLDKLNGQKFSVIKVSHVLEHVPNLRDLLTCMASLLEKDGVLIINVPNQDSFPSRLKIFLRNFGIRRNEFGYVQPPIHLHGFTKDSFQVLASAFGMKVIQCYGYSPLDESNFPTAPDYWRNIGVQKMLYMIGRHVNSGGYMTAILQKV